MKNIRFDGKQREKKVKRDIDSFTNDYQCNDIDCNCDGTYKACFAICGGKVIPTTRCVAFCNQ